MCGIAGLLRVDRRGLAPALAAMSETLVHRGPDDLGYFALGADGADHHGRTPPPDGPWQLGFAFRRLAILDLSDAGAQPMRSPDGRHVIVFNGEVYNYVELREQLAALGHPFRGGSDTEVVLAAYRQWGQDALDRFVGMFAFAILDRERRTLFLARDFFGIKPLYYTASASGFAFASEAKALLTLPEVGRRANPARIYDFLRFGRSDAGRETMLADVAQLPPGHCLTLALDGPMGQPEPVRYWQLAPVARHDLSFEEAVARTRELFLDSVRLHLRSDVPVGAALSGGIDSSAIVMAMRRLEPNLELHAFSFVAEDPAVSEERYMRVVGEAAGAHLHTVTPRAAELATDLDRLIAAQDFPCQADSLYAQYRVFGLAREHGITVMLDGQGADELLAGYRYYLAARLASLLRQGRPDQALAFVRRARPVLGSQGARLFLQAGGLLLPPGLQAAARRLVGEELTPPWLDAAWLARHGVVAASPYQAHGREVMRDQLTQAVTDTSLPSLLRFEDRNAMAHSVESRVPYLTPALSRFLLSLPEDYLLAPDGTSKAVFRAAMRGLVPDVVLDRRDKVGFTTPGRAWLEQLAPWVDQVLATERETPLHLPAARAEWQAVRAGRRPFSQHTWRWLSFLRWVEQLDVRFW